MTDSDDLSDDSSVVTFSNFVPLFPPPYEPKDYKANKDLTPKSKDLTPNFADPAPDSIDFHRRSIGSIPEEIKWTFKH